MIGALCLLAGAALLAWWLTTPETESADAPDDGPAIASELPVTVAPLDDSRRSMKAMTEARDAAKTPAIPTTTPDPTVTVTSASPANSDDGDDTGETGATPTSPLADLLEPAERGGALPVEVVVRPSPISMEISTIDVSRFPIREVGLESNGQLEIPDETEIGWYGYGATAGDVGATVLAAHVSFNNTTGPFFELGVLDPGAKVAVALDDGTERHYEVVERARYEKDALPSERIWRNTGPETLVLITCGGDFNPDLRRYRHNIVVYAVPVG